MFVTFALGVPFLYYRLIALSTTYMKRLPSMLVKEEDRWITQTELTNSSCKSLFAMFEYRWRFYKLILLLQKLMVVMLSIYATQIPLVLTAGLFLIQLVFTAIGFRSNPYVSSVEVRIYYLLLA